MAINLSVWLPSSNCPLYKLGVCAIAMRKMKSRAMCGSHIKNRKLLHFYHRATNSPTDTASLVINGIISIVHFSQSHNIHFSSFCPMFDSEYASDSLPRSDYYYVLDVSCVVCFGHLHQNLAEVIFCVFLTNFTPFSCWLCYVRKLFFTASQPVFVCGWQKWEKNLECDAYEVRV